MKSKATMLGLVVAVLMIGGCGGPDTHEKVMQDSLNMMKKMISIVESVDDEASAKAAVTKINALESQAKAIQARMEKLGEPTPEQDKALEAKFKSQFEEFMPKMIGVAMKVAQYPELQKAMDGVSMDSMGN